MPIVSLDRNARGAMKASLIDADGWREVFGVDVGGQTTTMAPVTSFATLGFLRRCVALRAGALAGLPFGIYREDADVGDYDAALFTEADEPPPDLAPLAGFSRSLWQSEASLALEGAAYHIILRDLPGRGRDSALGRFRGLQYVSPTTIEPDKQPQGVSGFIRTVNGVRVPYPAEAILHVWQPDPYSELGPGSSDARAAGPNAQTLGALTSFLSDHLSNGLVKMTVLTNETGRALTREQATASQDKWWHFLQRRGPARQGPPILDGVTPTIIGEGLGELANQALTQEQREAIAAAMGVPFSLVMSSAANYATAQVEERAFLLNLVLPQARILQDAINAQLLKGYGLALRFEGERHEVMQQFELEKAAAVVAVVGGPVLTVDEGRALLGKGPMEAGDVVQEAPPEAPPEAPEPEPAASGDGAMRALVTIAPEAKDTKARAWAATDALKAEGSRPVERAAAALLAALVDAIASTVSGADDAITALASFDLAAWADRVPEAFRTSVLRALEAGWRRGSFLASTVMPWDATDPRIGAVAARLLNAASGVPATVLAQAETAARNAIAAGMDRDEIAGAIRAALSDVPDTRARLIAQTTGTGAFEAGQSTAYAEAGIEEVMWLSERDGSVRDSHGAADGETVPLGQAFSNGLQYPGDPAGPVSEIANCRCTTLPVIRPEAEARTWAQRRNAHMRSQYVARRAAGEERGDIIEAMQEGTFEGKAWALSYDSTRRYCDGG